jgi:hypothetical protein
LVISNDLQCAYIKERILPVRIRTKTIRKAVRILEKGTYIVELLATSAKNECECLLRRFGQSENCRKRRLHGRSIRDLIDGVGLVNFIWSPN